MLTSNQTKCFDSQNEHFIITDIHNIAAFDENLHKTLVLTEGWSEGPVAAILRGGINAKATIEYLAASGVVDLTIFHITEKIPQLEDIFLATVVKEANHLFPKVKIVWRHDASVGDLIRSIASHYSMLFFGAPLAKSEITPFYQVIKRDYSGNVAIIRGPVSDEDFVEGDEIFKWVRERTFEAKDFSLPAVLRNYKKKLDKKIAIILPTLNEEKTIAKVIETALEVKNVGIIDELILVDSASTDGTVAIAEGFGIPIYKHPEICPELGSYRGKGEAMFKSGLITKADIIAWVDTDIENITPTFFYGLIGPMLANPDIRFVKGYFERPVRIETTGVELGGGRVTEILARPWINTFMPDLSGFIQPLAGTVAIYRDLLYQTKIPTNYGVEIAMLIQVLQCAGLWATCQVNLGEVIHKSKDVMGLSEMAFQIIQVLAAIQGNVPGATLNNSLRHVFTTGGNFEISMKRFETHWRKY